MRNEEEIRKVEELGGCGCRDIYAVDGIGPEQDLCETHQDIETAEESV